MGFVLILAPVTLTVLWILLARSVPKKHVAPLFLITFMLAIVAFGIGYLVGGIEPTYRGDIAVSDIIRYSDSSLSAGECDRVRTTFSEAHRLLRSGARSQEAAALVRTRLQTTSDYPSDAEATKQTGQ